MNKPMKINQRVQILLLCFALGVLIVAPRLPRLGYYTTADEPQYLKTAAKFFHTFQNKDFSDSPKGFHPGITALWAGYGGFAIGYPDYADRENPSIGDTGLIFTLLRKGTSVIEVLAYARFWMILMQASLLILSFILLIPLVGKWPAFLSIAFVSLDPFFFAHSRFLGVDGLLGNIMFTSALATVNYFRSKKQSYLYLAGGLTGLGILTKTPALFMFGILGIGLLLQFWRELKTDRKSNLISSVFHKLITPLTLYSISALVVVYALWPALWFDPNSFWELMVFTIESVGGGHSTATFFNGEVVQTGNFGLEYFYFYPLIYLWRTTPGILIGVIGAIVLVWKNESKQAKNIGLLAVYAFLYLLAISLSAKKFDRYLLPIFPPLAVIASLGWIWIAEKTANIINKANRKLVIGAVIGVGFLFQAVPLVSTFPYYISYYNPLMGGGKAAPQVMMIGWGEGLDEAARLLNEIPGITEKNVYTWYPHIFDYYFFRKVNTRSNYFEISGTLSDEQFEDFINADFAVIYVHQMQRSMSPKVLAYLDGEKPSQSVWIDGIKYVQIFDLKKIRAQK
ncbi:MAG: glycosyltransferase family 39 protein [Chloroflexota bacterium]